MSFNACDINVSMLLCLLFASISIWSCFFFFFIVVLTNFLIIPAVIDKIKVKHALAIPAGTPTVFANEIIDTPLLDTLKRINILSV